MKPKLKNSIRIALASAFILMGSGAIAGETNAAATPKAGTNSIANPRKVAVGVTRKQVEQGLTTISNEVAVLRDRKNQIIASDAERYKRWLLQVQSGQIPFGEYTMDVGTLAASRQIDRQIAALKLQEFDIRKRYGIPEQIPK